MISEKFIKTKHKAIKAVGIEYSVLWHKYI